MPTTWPTGGRAARARFWRLPGCCFCLRRLCPHRHPGRAGAALPLHRRLRFAGYARIATLGEEIKYPARILPRAIPAALDFTLVVYAAVSATALWGVGPEVLAEAGAPLAAATDAGSWNGLTPGVRVGAAIASAGTLMTLVVGMGRTTFTMAAEGDLPRVLDKVHPTLKVPHHAEIAVVSVVIVLVSLTDLRNVLGFSSFCMLFYYAVTNASAWTLPPPNAAGPVP